MAKKPNTRGGKAKSTQESREQKYVLNTKFALCQISPKTTAQKEVFDKYDSGKNLVMHGSAGTGKTFLSLYLAIKDVFKEAMYDKVVIIRSAVQTRDQGFMPGGPGEKMAEYEGVYSGVVNELFNRNDAYKVLKGESKISVISTSFIRGITIDNAIVIVDECQSMTYHELDTCITRIGESSRIFFCGDTNQNDLIKNRYDVSGLGKFMEVLKSVDAFDFVEFTHQDIVRSELVKQYIVAKDMLMAA